MELTPLDIHHKEFHRAIRGYSEEEVDVFLDQVADDHERLFNQNRELKEQVEKMKDKVTQYEGLEQTLQKAILTAQQAADEVQASAQKESELIVKDAELKAKQIIQDVASEKQRVGRELEALKDAEKKYRNDFKQLLNSYLEVIAGIEKGEQEEAESVISIEEEPAAAVEEAAEVFSPPESQATVDEDAGSSEVNGVDMEAGTAMETEAAPTGANTASENKNEEAREEKIVSAETFVESAPENQAKPGGEDAAAKAEAEDERSKKQKSSEDYEDFFNSSSFFGNDTAADTGKSGQEGASEESAREERKESTDEGRAEQASGGPREFDIPDISYDYPETTISDRGPGDSSHKFSGFFDDSIGDENDQTGGFRPRG